MLVQTPFLDLIVLFFYFCSKTVRCGDLFKIQWAPKRDQLIDQVAQYRWTTQLCDTFGPHRKTQIHAETPSGLDLRVSIFFIFRCSNLGGTNVNKYIIFHVSVAQNTSRDTERMGPPKSNGRQKGYPSRTRGTIRLAFIDVFGFSDFSGMLVCQSLFCSNPHSWRSFLRIFSKIVDLGTPSKSSGRQNGTNDQVAKYWWTNYLFDAFEPHQTTQINEETPSGLDR